MLNRTKYSILQGCGGRSKNNAAPPFREIRKGNSGVRETLDESKRLLFLINKPGLLGRCCE